MKEEKVCINKTIALLAAVTVLVLGVVVFTNYVNTQNLSTDSRATGATNTLLDKAYWLITCPVSGKVQVWQQGPVGTYYKDSGVCAACADLTKSQQMKSCQKCCNMPATEAEYLALHPNPAAIDCTKEDPATGRKAGYYYMESDNKTCYGIGTKAVNSAKPNQKCQNEIFTDAGSWPAACTSAIPTPMTCSGKYTLSAGGTTCDGVGTKLVNSETINQYCGNEHLTGTLPPACKSQAPTAIDCAATGYYYMNGTTECYGIGTKAVNPGTFNQYCDNEKFTKGVTWNVKCNAAVPTQIICTGTYSLSADGGTCYGTGTKLMNEKTINQYCGNEVLTSSFPAGCTGRVPTGMTCPQTSPKVYKDGGDACYMMGGKLLFGGTGNQRCDNLKMADWKCCGDANASGCQ